MKQSSDGIRPERVEELSRELSSALKNDLISLRAINAKTSLLSVNARIEAANAGGTAGAAFSVIANEVMMLAKTMDASFKNLEQQTAAMLRELGIIGSKLASDTRGQRLADLAAAHLDVIDRNLYERSCDVRWWATDNGLVKALTTKSPEDIHYASNRMGIILNSYTVYFDLVLCDKNGMVIANGRPQMHRSCGSTVSSTNWFKQALSSTSGSEFGFESVHNSSLVNNKRVLIYSCAVREHGDECGEIIGALGVVFNWDALGQTIVDNAAISSDEQSKTAVFIATATGELCASHGLKSNAPLPVDKWLKASQSTRFYLTDTWNGRKNLIALARSIGFETYKTGWISGIMQLTE
jgi:Methyl-accepting chemotaxis protein (MCP) signalling domain